MKKFRLLFSIAFFLILYVFNLSAQNSKMSITILDTYSASLKKDTLSRFNNIITQQLVATNKFIMKTRDQLDKVLRMMDINSVDKLDETQAADIGGKMGSQLVVLSSGSYRNNSYYFELKVIKSVTGAVYAQVQNEFKNLNDAENLLPEMLTYLVDEVVLIDSYFTRNYYFFTESEAVYNEKAAKNPTLNLPNGSVSPSPRANFGIAFDDPRNFFAIYPLDISVQGAYNQPIGAYYGHILPAGYCSILADYALYTTDLFVISPLVGLNYSVYDIDPVIIKGANLVPMPVLGMLAGCDFALSLPMFRLLSFHLKTTGGFTVSFIRVAGAEKTDISNDPIVNISFESRLTFMQKLSLSIFVNYMAIFFDSDFLIQDVKIGGGLGYRF